MFIWLNQFLSLVQCMAICVFARMTKQVWKVIGAVEPPSDVHRRTASVSEPGDWGKKFVYPDSVCVSFPLFPLMFL